MVEKLALQCTVESTDMLEVESSGRGEFSFEFQSPTSTELRLVNLSAGDVAKLVAFLAPCLSRHADEVHAKQLDEAGAYIDTLKTENEGLKAEIRTLVKNIQMATLALRPV